jgi:hypothetical protein
VYKDFEVGVNYNYFGILTNLRRLVSRLDLTQKHRVKASFGNENYLKTLVSMLVEDITLHIYGNLQWLTV